MSPTNDDEYDLVLLDLMLPGFDGFEVLRRVLGREPEHRVLVLSALGDVTSRVQCQEGSRRLPDQGVRLAELVARVKARLRTPKAGVSQSWLMVGHATLDLERQTIEVEGRAVPLSHREFLLLGQLMRRAGEVCSRDELLAGVRGYIDPRSNEVDVAVCRVRGKVPGAADQDRTQHGLRVHPGLPPGRRRLAFIGADVTLPLGSRAPRTAPVAGRTSPSLGRFT